MNRKTFLTSALSFLGLASIAPVVKATELKRRKYGFIHIEHLPLGSAGDWLVIDNKTGKFYNHPNESKDANYYILYAHEESGIVGGIIQYRSVDVIRPWSEKVDFRLEYRPDLIKRTRGPISDIIIPASKDDILALRGSKFL